MPTALRQIADATRNAWDHANAILLAARLDGAPRPDCDALADYCDAARDRWLLADARARFEDDQRTRREPIAEAAATFDFAAMEWGHE